MEKDGIKRFKIDLIRIKKGKREACYYGGTSGSDISPLCAYMLVKYFEENGYVVKRECDPDPENSITHFCVYERAGNVICRFSDSTDFSKFRKKIGKYTLKFVIGEIE